MLGLRLSAAASLLFLCSALGEAQIISIIPAGQADPSRRFQSTAIDWDVALKRSLEVSSLTFSGKPFHAVMEIGTEGTDYSGRIEVWWIKKDRYKIEVRSPKFNQVKTVNGEKVQEKIEGDYYPRWLENFVLALLNPVPMAGNFAGKTVGVMTFHPQSQYSVAVTMATVNRDDRVNGITDQMTVGSVSFDGPELSLRSTSAFNESMVFGDWTEFHKKKIARSYETKVLDDQKLVGHLVKLEDLKHPDPSIFEVTEAVPAEQPISTAFISTSQEESMIEKMPEIQWPGVRDGRTDGYMIVYARTDRTGQVRETAEYSSDNSAVSKFGMEQALRYKFKPLIVDGVAVQFETPLVLHFTSRIENPIPILTVEEMKTQMISCTPQNLPHGTVAAGTTIHYRISVNESGKAVEFMPVLGDERKWLPKMEELKYWVGAINSLAACTFKPYVVNGQPTYYKGDVELVAQ
jgi:hypothetical protein